MTRALLVLVLGSTPAFAQGGHVHWMNIGVTWTWDAWVTLPLGLSGILYAVGTSRCCYSRSAGFFWLERSSHRSTGLGSTSSRRT